VLELTTKLRIELEPHGCGSEATQYYRTHGWEVGVDVEDMLTRVWEDLVARIHGPFSFRFLLQPLMGLLFATRDGIVDARQHRPAYFWSVLFTPANRNALLREGWNAVLRVVTVGMVMDIIFQLMVFGRVYPFELVIIVVALAFVPYVMFRGPANRIARAWMTRKVRT